MEIKNQKIKMNINKNNKEKAYLIKYRKPQ